MCSLMLYFRCDRFLHLFSPRTNNNSATITITIPIQYHMGGFVLYRRGRTLPRILRVRVGLSCMENPKIYILYFSDKNEITKTIRYQECFKSQMKTSHSNGSVVRYLLKLLTLFMIKIYSKKTRQKILKFVTNRSNVNYFAIEIYYIYMSTE